MSIQDPTARYLRAPRLPKSSPVTVLHVRADSDVDGNPRRCFAVLTPSGRTVAVIDEGFGGESVLRASWPWFDHTVAQALGLHVAYTRGIDVSVSEYRNWLRTELDEETPELLKLRRLAERCAKYTAVWEAISAIRTTTAAQDWRQSRADAEGRANLYADDPRGAIVYHRELQGGGDSVSVHVRRAMDAMTRAGMVERVELHDAYGRYVATDSTPDPYARKAGR